LRGEENNVQRRGGKRKERKGKGGIGKGGVRGFSPSKRFPDGTYASVYY